VCGSTTETLRHGEDTQPPRRESLRRAPPLRGGTAQEKRWKRNDRRAHVVFPSFFLSGVVGRRSRPTRDAALLYVSVSVSLCLCVSGGYPSRDRSRENGV